MTSLFSPRDRAVGLVTIVACAGLVAGAVGAPSPAPGRAAHRTRADSSSAVQATDPGAPPRIYAVGSPAMRAAQSIAVSHWGRQPCGGDVTISWVAMGPGVNAQSAWDNPKSLYDDPQLNSACAVELNSAATFDWEKLCTVVVHEYGHLTGHRHSSDPSDVMAPFYRQPLDACRSTPPGVTTEVPGSQGAATSPAVAPQHARAGSRRRARATRRHRRHHRRR